MWLLILLIAGVVRLHTTLEADLSQASRKSIVKRNSMWGMSSKPPMIQIHFLIEAEVGVADVKFRCREYPDLFHPRRRERDLISQWLLTDIVDSVTHQRISQDAGVELEMKESSEPLADGLLVREGKEL